MGGSIKREMATAAFGMLVVSLLSACSTTSPRSTRHEPIKEAREEIPEEMLLDVGITVFDPGELDSKQADEAGTSEQIRKAESHYIPYHLKNTLQQSGHWGAVRVVPGEIASVDLLLSGEILKSNGEELRIEVRAVDATGKTWLDKTCGMKIDGLAYGDTVPELADPFQGVYNEIANDLAATLQKIPPGAVESIRTTSRMRFAADFSPAPFADYLERKNNRYRVVRLPAEDDAMIERLLQVRDREYMYVDTLDEYYERFYQDLWPQYENWRKFSQTEMEALRKVQRQATGRIVSGVAMIAAAIALEMADVENTETLRNVLVLGGGAVVIDGVNVSKGTAIHKAGIEELTDSFSADLDTIILEFEGKRIELTGTAEEQYQQWRDLLRRIYDDETGFGDDTTL